MLQYGDADYTEIKKSDLVNVLISCDIAVQIAKVDYKESKLIFDWKQIGTPSTAKNIPRYCKDNNIHEKGTLVIKELAPDETAQSLAEAISKILKTSEQYLATAGVPFHNPPEPNTEGPLRGGVAPPKNLLAVDPIFSDEARKKRHNATVTISITVAPDGLVRNPKIIDPAGMSLDEQALAVLSLWRFQPASKNGTTVTMQFNVAMDFHVM